MVLQVVEWSIYSMTPCGVDSLCSVYWSVLQPLVYVHSFVASQLVSNQKFYCYSILNTLR